MAEPNTNQNQGNTDPAQGAGQSERTFSQADVDRLVADRLERERKKYADYGDLKKAKEELDALKAGQMSELERTKADLETARKNAADTEAKFKALELSTLKARLAAEAKIPAEFVDRIRGNDEAEIKADIEALGKILPRVSTGGQGTPAAANNTGADLQTLYAEAMKNGRIEEAMIYKKQLFEKLGG